MGGHDIFASRDGHLDAVDGIFGLVIDGSE